MHGLADDLRARGIGEPLELLEVLVYMHCVVRTFAGCTDQKRTFDRRLYIDQLADSLSLSKQFLQRHVAVALQLHALFPDRGVDQYRPGQTIR